MLFRSPVTSKELYDQAFKRLDAIVKREGGPEALRNNPELVPQVHIRGDVNARFEDIGRVLYAIQRGGVVKVGFITEPDRGIRGSR